MDIYRTLLAGFAASIAWFIIGGALYSNPIVARMYKNAETSPALKKWPSIPKYIGLQYVGILAQCLLWSFVFMLVKTSFPETFLMKSIIFGLILIATKIFPRLFDMWIQSTYPCNLLIIEFINGAIGCFIIGGVFAYLI